VTASNQKFKKILFVLTKQKNRIYSVQRDQVVYPKSWCLIVGMAGISNLNETIFYK